MNDIKAEQIVRAYGQIIADRQSPFQKISSLPYPIEKIKAAYFIFINSIINKNGYLPKEMGDNLVLTYAMLGSFINDQEAVRLSSIWKAIQNKTLIPDSTENKKLIHDTVELFTKVSMDEKLFNDINSFIAGCLPD